VFGWGASSEGAELGLSAIGGRVRRGGVLGEVAELGLSAPRGAYGEGGEFGGASAEPRDPGRVGRDA
jgi:hypothetical protein